MMVILAFNELMFTDSIFFRKIHEDMKLLFAPLLFFFIVVVKEFFHVHFQYTEYFFHVHFQYTEYFFHVHFQDTE